MEILYLRSVNFEGSDVFQKLGVFHCKWRGGGPFSGKAESLMRDYKLGNDIFLSVPFSLLLACSVFISGYYYY